MEAEGLLGTPVAEPTEDEEEAEEESFYEAHCEELLAVLRCGGPAKLQERGEGGVGLMNQGATCYMNSLLQSLFYTPEFRLAVYGFEYDPDLHGEASRCIPLQLQKLFAELQMSVAGAASTKDLTTACGFTGRDAMQQHDVQELCRVLFDALERSSSLLADAIRGLYAGKSTSYIKCREEINGKVYQSARTEKYMDLQVPIQDCSSLEEALRKLVEPEVMEGDNQWLCEELGKKVDALKGLTIESLPKILCIQLLRFVFDVATMRRKKLSEVVALPLILDLAFLSDSGIGPSSYQLAAVCLHSGTAHGGHYHAFAWDPCSGAWRDANDTRVQVLSAKQCSALFGAADDAQPQALHSADAYFLLYRRVSQTEVPSVQDAAIPQCLRDALLSENQNLSRLQRAYDLHRKLLEVEVFLPLAAERALQRYAATQLEALGAAAPEAEPEMSVTVKTSSQRPAAAVQRKVLKSLASSDMSWCRDVDLAALKSARLRLYDPWRGLPGRLLEGSALGDCLGGGFNSTATLVMELPDASGCFEQWQEDRTVTFLVLWDRQLGAPSLGSGSVVALRLPPAEEACAAGEANLAKEPTQVPPSTETYEPETEEVQQDLFALEVPAEPARSHGDRSPLLRTVREAAATLWNLPASSYLALVPLSGMQAGKELKGDDLTLQGSGCEYGDIICVEQLEGPGVSQAVQLVEEKCNTAKIYFNHPTRPQFTEEFPPMAISKDAPIFELKARIAQALQLDASTLHLCRSQHAPAMFKDESRTLRQAGLSEASSIFVGDGAPCSPEECLLKVLLYTYDKGNHKARELFSLAARGDSSVRNLREAVYEPLLRWAKEEDPEAIGFDPVAVTGWKKLRLRDGQAGKQFAILRDERTLRSALLGFGDGRQVAVQVMAEDEDLGPDDLVILVRPWRVREARLHASTEIVATRNQSLAKFQDMLAERFKGLLHAEEEKDNVVPVKSTDEISQDGKEHIAPVASGKPTAETFKDSLEIVAAHNTGPPLTSKRCETLKWADSRLTPGPQTVEKPLADFKEVRDGVTLVIRSRLAALAGVEVSEPAAGPSKGGKKGVAKASAKAALKAKGGDSTVTVSTGRAERGLIIQVAHPETEAEEAAPVSPNAI